MQKFGPDCCFICGAGIPPGSPERTVEHVFPKWLLHSLGLWDAKITQLNDRTRAYRQFVVPCCRRCNGQVFSPIEERVKQAAETGFDGFAALDRTDLFLWLGKIYYGILVRESFLPLDVTDHDGPRLVPQAALESNSLHHLLLQAAAGTTTWRPLEPGPASIHFFRCLVADDLDLRFDYLDDVAVPVIALRFGPIGVVACLQDWGRSEGVQAPHLEAARSIELHPTQFREVYARLCYITRKSWINVSVPVLEVEGQRVVIAPASMPFEGEFNPTEFAPALARVWGVETSAIADVSGVRSTLMNADGSGFQVPDAETYLRAPFANTGLWPAHELSMP
ncbi:hypothetical protein [Agrococcus jejuensis]|uniref:hypothetical protein n=1 Tax=Agrococcus jejuensis TaxID=399736 RepID=UPI000B8300D0|nr:hypothetical protein [Agrococcus jejuensis]